MCIYLYTSEDDDRYMLARDPDANCVSSILFSASGESTKREGTDEDAESEAREQVPNDGTVLDCKPRFRSITTGYKTLRERKPEPTSPFRTHVYLCAHDLEL